MGEDPLDIDKKVEDIDNKIKNITLGLSIPRFLSNSLQVSQAAGGATGVLGEAIMSRRMSP
jgi:hypothetical protein